MTGRTGKGRDGGEPQTPLEHFGEEVRLERERLGIEREELGKEAFCGYSLVSKIETGKRVPSPEFGEACDRLFPDSHGRFSRLAAFVLKCAFQPSFRKYVELEEIAATIRRYNCMLVPGLIQTEDYARALMATGRARNQEDLVTARMARQRILLREHPPALWLILEEIVLRRAFGGREVMREQLKRILTLAAQTPHVVQVLPEREDAVHGQANQFGILSFDEGADVAHVEAFPNGLLLTEPREVAMALQNYALLSAKALSPDESFALIESVLKERYS
ncbi:helix-turn-helix domain-containing protein [Streptomyces huiliensis]|uniref:helix-turn-helix domain-containing protein n=1 Tax=Streptomyces huiliensis TaxID=2876027 RepID=UPI001CBCDBD5|nr:helix-turn-helix transcriptional regulator [Streptomyces huiliensis]MBZ4321039.1 helix-turn-helix transcriptional regulator [Streptomyces huiliensis]